MKTLVAYAMSWIGRPYIWGGDDFSGWDCSGFAQELLGSVGMDPPGDQSAHALWQWLIDHGGEQLKSPRTGAFVFYGQSAVGISHVAMCVDYFRVVEAGGGDSTTRTPADAAKQNAFVRIRPFDRRSDIIAIVMPRYERLMT